MLKGLFTLTKANAKAKKYQRTIEKRSKKTFQTSKKIVAFTFPFAQCEWTLKFQWQWQSILVLVVNINILSYLSYLHIFYLKLEMCERYTAFQIFYTYSVWHFLILKMVWILKIQLVSHLQWFLGYMKSLGKHGIFIFIWGKDTYPKREININVNHKMIWIYMESVKDNNGIFA